MTVEIIEWVDSMSLGRWNRVAVHENHAKDSIVCRSMGFVFYETDDRIGLIQSLTVGKFDKQEAKP